MGCNYQPMISKGDLSNLDQFKSLGFRIIDRKSSFIVQNRIFVKK